MKSRHCSGFSAVLIAFSTSSAASADGIRFLNPDGLFKPITFTQIAILALAAPELLVEIEAVAVLD